MDEQDKPQSLDHQAHVYTTRTYTAEFGHVNDSGAAVPELLRVIADAESQGFTSYRADIRASAFSGSSFTFTASGPDN